MLVVILDRALTGEEYDEVFDWVSWSSTRSASAGLTMRPQKTARPSGRLAFSTHTPGTADSMRVSVGTATACRRASWSRLRVVIAATRDM